MMNLNGMKIITNRLSYESTNNETRESTKQSTKRQQHKRGQINSDKFTNVNTQREIIQRHESQLRAEISIVIWWYHITVGMLSSPGNIFLIPIQIKSCDNSTLAPLVICGPAAGTFCSSLSSMLRLFTFSECVGVTEQAPPSDTIAVDGSS